MTVEVDVTRYDFNWCDRMLSYGLERCPLLAVGDVDVEVESGLSHLPVFLVSDGLSDTVFIAILHLVGIAA